MYVNMFEDNNTTDLSVRHSIVASIPACHAGDRGSIPRLGDYFYQQPF